MALPGSRVLAWIVALAAFLAQVPGFARAWIWDDELLLRGTDLYTSADRWTESLSKSLGAETFYWRPLATTSYLAGALLHGVDALWYRVGSATLHAASAALVFVLAERLVRARGVALAAALLWGLHPVHMEAATWISGRFDLLAGLCTLLALVAVPGEAGGARGRLVLVGAACCGAVLAKESAVVVPLVAGLWAAACDDGGGGALGARLRAARPVAMAALVGVGVALFARVEATGVLFGWRGGEPAEAGFARFVVVGRAAAEYAAVLVAPWVAAGPAHHVERPVGVGDPAAWGGVALLVAGAAAALVSLRRGGRRGFLLCALAASLAPVLQILPIDLAGGLLIADRYLYLPSAILALLSADVAAGFLASRPRALRPAVVVVGLLAVSFAAARVVLLPRWNDPVRFWAWASSMAPESGFVRVSYGNALRRAGDLDAAEREARAAQQVHPRLLAEVLVDKGRLTDALAVLDAAVAAGKADLDTRLYRGETRYQAGDVPRAGEDAAFVLSSLGDESRTFQPLRAAALALAANASAVAGDRAGAARMLADAERLAASDDARGWAAITACAAALPDVPRTIAAAERARAAGAPEIAMRVYVADAFAAAGRHAEAAAEFRRILGLSPPDPAVFLDRLGYELFDAGDVAGAEAALREALAAAPDFPRARYHLAVLLAKGQRRAEAKEQADRLAQALARNPDPSVEAGLPALRALLVE